MFFKIKKKTVEKISCIVCLYRKIVLYGISLNWQWAVTPTFYSISKKKSVVIPDCCKGIDTPRGYRFFIHAGPAAQ